MSHKCQNCSPTSCFTNALRQLSQEIEILTLLNSKLFMTSGQFFDNESFLCVWGVHKSGVGLLFSHDCEQDCHEF